MAFLAGVTALAYLAIAAIPLAALFALHRAYRMRDLTTRGHQSQEALDRWTDLLVRIMLTTILSLVWMGFGVATHFISSVGNSQDNLLYRSGQADLALGYSLRLAPDMPTAVLDYDSASALDCVESIHVQNDTIAGHAMPICGHDFAAPPQASYFLIRFQRGVTMYPSLAALEAANGGPVHLEPVRDYYFRHLYGPRDLLTILIFFVPPTLAFRTIFRRIRLLGELRT